MSDQPIPQPARRERMERHNPSVDEDLAAAGRCAQVHLPSGRICVREHLHRGSCQFTTPDVAHDVIDSEQPGASPAEPGS
jgi:hypothetical protein